MFFLLLWGKMNSNLICCTGLVVSTSLFPAIECNYSAEKAHFGRGEHLQLGVASASRLINPLEGTVVSLDQLKTAMWTRLPLIGRGHFTDLHPNTEHIGKSAGRQKHKYLWLQTKHQERLPKCFPAVNGSLVWSDTGVVISHSLI